MRLSIDTGGTFTDLILEDERGGVSLYKRPTTPGNPVLGILDVVDVAAQAHGVSRRELLANSHTLIHATTHSLNALITGTVARTAFLTNHRHPDILLLREGGREHFNARDDYPTPLVPRSLTFGMGGRIIHSGREIEPFDEEAARATIATLANLGIEAVAVCFLWSIANPAHELACASILDLEAPTIPYTLSHELNPCLREYRRGCAAAIDASLKPLMREYLSSLREQLRQNGFLGRLLMATSSGTLLDADAVSSAPIHTIKSGPSMAPVAGRAFASELGYRAAIVTDTGGTSYDVSTVIDGRIPWTRETWLGRPYHSHITGFPSVDVRSQGAGGGSIAWVDSGGVLHVGPQSAGADPGPVAYGRGGREPTVTDAALALRLIDSAEFLGGQMALDVAAAARSIDEYVGSPLRLPTEDAAAAIIQVTTEQMARAVEDTVLRGGIDPRQCLLVAGGGAAGLNAVGVARRVGITEIAVPGVSAALSAAGALISEVGKDFRRAYPVRTTRFDFQGVAQVVGELREQATGFLDNLALPGWTFGSALYCEGHYARQVWEIEINLHDVPRSQEDVADLVNRFHQRHAELYAVADHEAVIEVLSWRVRAWARKPEERISLVDVAAVADGPHRQDHHREVFFPSFGWRRTLIVRLEELPEGVVIPGPSIVTSKVTTTVIEPGAVARIGRGRTLVVTLKQPNDESESLETSLAQ